MAIKIEEKNILIARRVPPGGKWRLVANEPDGAVHKTLTDSLEAYMVKTGFKGSYKLEPLKSNLSRINQMNMLKKNYLLESMATMKK